MTTVLLVVGILIMASGLFSVLVGVREEEPRPLVYMGIIQIAVGLSFVNVKFLSSTPLGIALNAALLLIVVGAGWKQVKLFREGRRAR